MDRHPLSIRGRHLPFRAVDNVGTILREDAFAFSEMPYGFDLYIASIIPPTPLTHPRILEEALLILHTSKNTIEKDKKWIELLHFCRNERFGDPGFSTSKEKPAVVARYAVAREGGVKEIDLTAGRVQLEQVFTSEQYLDDGHIQADSRRLKAMLEELEISDNDRERERVEAYAKKSVDKDIREGMSALFSSACRLAAVKQEIPFVGIVRDGGRVYLEFSPTKAVFGRSLRDPLGFINLMNLGMSLQGKVPPFSVDTLIRAKPDAFVPPQTRS